MSNQDEMVEQQARRGALLEDLYTAESLATELDVTPRAVYLYVKEGRLKGQKVGGRWRFTRRNVDKFINGE